MLLKIYITHVKSDSYYKIHTGSFRCAVKHSLSNSKTSINKPIPCNETYIQNIVTILADFFACFVGILYQ